MTCGTCGKAMPEGSRFCAECGSRASGDSRRSAQEPEPSVGGLASRAAGPGVAAAAPGADVSIGAQVSVAGPGEATVAAAAAGAPLAERYELLEEIGRGGFAVVWRARDRKLDRDVAVKRLRPELAGATGIQAAQTLRRFEQEARVIAALNHRNVVQVLDHEKFAELIEQKVMMTKGAGASRENTHS